MSGATDDSGSEETLPAPIDEAAGRSVGLTAALTQTLEPGSNPDAEETLPASQEGPPPLVRGRSGASDTNFGRGDQLGRYVIVDELGAGGMGVVFAAYDPDLDRKVALKVLRQNAYGRRRGTEGKSRLVREAQALAKLDHPNVVSIFDAGVSASQVWIAMEFVKGETLEQRFASHEPGDWRSLTELMLQAGEGLVAAHTKGLVHRDFKPANVMVDDQGRVRVMDFGLVHLDTESQTDDGAATDVQTSPALVDELTQLGTVIGTPAYMAPEQHRGWSTDARTDQFAYCITLWLGLHGERPFAGKTLAELAYNVTSGIVREPPKSEVPAWFDAILRRGLAVEPVDRWPSMAALLDAIRVGLARRTRSPWKGLLAIAGLVGLVAGSWGLWSLDRLQTREACEQAGLSIHGIWTAERRAAGAAAFHATELGFADDSWARTERLFDDWAERWSQLRTQACVDAKLDELWTEDAYADVVACFELRAAEFEALAETSTEADASFIPRAVSSAAHLSDPGRCLDPTWLAIQLMPEDPAARAQTQALRKAAVEVSTLLYAANYDEAQALAEQALVDAQTLGWAPAEAEARYVLGGVHNGRGQLDEALDSHSQAFFLAAEAGHDHLAARAATSIVGLYSRKAKPDQALHWAELGQTFLARSQFTRSAEHRALMINRGAVLMDIDDNEGARAAFEAAIASFEAELGPEHPDIIVPLINLGIVQRKLERDDLADEAFIRAASLARNHLGEHHPMHATALINVGTILSAAKRFDEALAIQEQAYAILEFAYGPDDPRVTFALNNKASLLLRLGRLDEALALHRRVLGIREQLGPEHPSLANSASNVAQALHALGRPVEALDYAERSVSIRVAAYGEHNTRVASSKYILATVLNTLGRHERAAGLLRDALAIRVEQNGAEHKLTAVTEVELARAELDLGNEDRAHELLEHATPIVESSDHPSRSSARFDRIRIDYRRGSEASALAAAEALRTQLAGLDSSTDASAERRRRVAELEAWLEARR